MTSQDQIESLVRELESNGQPYIGKGEDGITRTYIKKVDIRSLLTSAFAKRELEVRNAVIEECKAHISKAFEIIYPEVTSYTMKVLDQLKTMDTLKSQDKEKE